MGESMAIFPAELYNNKAASSKQPTSNRSSCHIYNYLNQGGYKNANGYEASIKAVDTGLVKDIPQFAPALMDSGDHQQQTAITVVTTPPSPPPSPITIVDKNNQPYNVITLNGNSANDSINTMYTNSSGSHQFLIPNTDTSIQYACIDNNNVYIHPPSDIAISDCVGSENSPKQAKAITRDIHDPVLSHETNTGSSSSPLLLNQFIDTSSSHLQINQPLATNQNSIVITSGSTQFDQNIVHPSFRIDRSASPISSISHLNGDYLRHTGLGNIVVVSSESESSLITNRLPPSLQVKQPSRPLLPKSAALIVHDETAVLVGDLNAQSIDDRPVNPLNFQKIPVCGINVTSEGIHGHIVMDNDINLKLNTSLPHAAEPISQLPNIDQNETMIQNTDMANAFTANTSQNCDNAFMGYESNIAHLNNITAEQILNGNTIAETNYINSLDVSSKSNYTVSRIFPPQYYSPHHTTGSGSHGRSRPDSPIVHRTLLQHDSPLDPEVFIQDTLVEGLPPRGDIIVNANINSKFAAYGNLQPKRPKSPVPDLIDDTRSGQPVQQISVITALPDLLKENNADCMRRVVPKVREVLHVAQQDMQLAACSSFLQILQKQLLPVPNYTQTFLQTIITSLDSRDPDIAKAWLETLLDVIDLLPKDVIRKEILTVAITKGQLSQSVQSRLSCCQILGKIATKFEPFVIKKDILPIVQSLCQDVDYEVRACMCRHLDPVARGLGLEQTKSAILPELVELTNDEKSHVRLAGLETVVKILSLLDVETCTNTIIPLVCKFCQQSMIKEDVTLPFVSKQLGKLCHQLQSNLTDEQKKWFIDFYKKLCKLGVKESDRPCNRDDDHTPPSRYGPLAFFQHTSDFEDEDPTIETRKNAAYNFPAMMLFIGPKFAEFKSELFSSFSSLCTDPSFSVRKNIALGFHEVVKSLHNNCSCLLHDLNHLLKDDSLEVLHGLTAHLSETLELFGKCVNNSTTKIEEKQNAFLELIPSMLQCEAVISSSNNWRLQVNYLEALSCLPSCYSSDLIFQKFVPLLIKKLLYGRALPVKEAAGKTLLVILKNNHQLEQRQYICVRLVDDLCHGRSCYHRNMFIEMCKMIMDDFSKAFFKDFFFEFLLELCSDIVPTVRLRVCALFPRLKRLIKLPADHNLLQKLETCVRKLLMSENDRDVKDVLDKSVKEFDRVQMHVDVGNRNRSQDEDIADRKKEDWEKKLLELEKQEREEEAKNSGKFDKKKDSGNKSNSSTKLQSLNRKVNRPSRIPIPVYYNHPELWRSWSESCLFHEQPQSTQGDAMSTSMSGSINSNCKKSDGKSKKSRGCQKSSAGHSCISALPRRITTTSTTCCTVTV